MKNSLPKILVVLAFLLLLPACFGKEESKEDTIKEEVAENKVEVVAKKKEVPKSFYISQKRESRNRIACVSQKIRKVDNLIINNLLIG